MRNEPADICLWLGRDYKRFYMIKRCACVRKSGYGPGEVGCILVEQPAMRGSLSNQKVGVVQAPGTQTCAWRGKIPIGFKVVLEGLSRLF